MPNRDTISVNVISALNIYGKYLSIGATLFSLVVTPVATLMTNPLFPSDIIK